jgi:hypothetical protein
MRGLGSGAAGAVQGEGGVSEKNETFGCNDFHETKTRNGFE